ncbi:hypothetical protein HJG60_009040 [Phyllostomus discolor]|uniref:Uncharacterized protein n=1 Tax=Phyllostomus discolor TaxID=89673 RepID=A0A833YQ78_9CHIR|nr:hypothetical protein HJG60_009040 [Phyllostomus discolor]
MQSLPCSAWPRAGGWGASSAGHQALPQPMGQSRSQLELFQRTCAECRRSSISLRNVDSRTSTPVSSVLTLPVVSSSAWRVPPPTVPSSTLWLSKGGNHMAPHCCWRTRSLGLAAELASSGPAPPSESQFSPISPGSFHALEGVPLLRTELAVFQCHTPQPPGPTCNHWVLGLTWQVYNLTTMLHPCLLPLV